MSNVVTMPPPEWTSGLMRFGSGAPQPSLANACHALRNAPELHSMLAYDVFAMKTMMVSPPPWEAEPEHDEDGADTEPSLGSSGHGQAGPITYLVHAISDGSQMIYDCEGDEHDGREPDEDGEPSLCGLTSDRRDHASTMGMV